MLEKNMVTKTNLKFWNPHHKNELWSQNMFFTKSILGFEKWTKINVQF